MGVPLVDHQKDLTPFQRQVLVRQYIKREEDKREKIEQEKQAESSGPPTMSSGIPNARSGKSKKVQAIENSQKEEDKFINTDLINND